MNEPMGKPFGLTLEKREKAVLTGVTDVERFDETEVVLRAHGGHAAGGAAPVRGRATHGGRLTLSGTGLHVSSLQLEGGRLLVDGTIDSASYDSGMPRSGGRRGGFLRRALG